MSSSLTVLLRTHRGKKKKNIYIYILEHEITYSVPVFRKQLPECFVQRLLDHWEIAASCGSVAQQTDSFYVSHSS